MVSGSCGRITSGARSTFPVAGKVRRARQVRAGRSGRGSRPTHGRDRERARHESPDPRRRAKARRRTRRPVRPGRRARHTAQRSTTAATGCQRPAVVGSSPRRARDRLRRGDRRRRGGVRRAPLRGARRARPARGRTTGPLADPSRVRRLPGRCRGAPGLAADIGEVIQQLVATLAATGWSEEDARTTNVHELAIDKTAIHRRN